MASTRDRTSQVDPFRASCTAPESLLFVVWEPSYPPLHYTGPPPQTCMAPWPNPSSSPKPPDLILAAYGRRLCGTRHRMRRVRQKPCPPPEVTGPAQTLLCQRPVGVSLTRHPQAAREEQAVLPVHPCVHGPIHQAQASGPSVPHPFRRCRS